MDIKEIKRDAQNRAEDALVRAVTAMVARKVAPDGDDKYLAKRPDDEVTRILFKAAATAGTIGAEGWASQLASTAVIQFVTGLGPMSGASQLFALALQIPIPLGRNMSSVPGVVPVGEAGAFVKELDPIPLTSWDFSAASLTYKKLSILTAITRDLAKSPAVENEIRRLLRESAGLTLDSVLFSASAATDAAPAGLFYGVDPIGPGTFDDINMVNDLTTLVAAVAPIGGDRLAFVTSPARAVQIGMRVPNLRFPVIASKSIADNRVAVLAVDALAVAANSVPEIDVSAEAVLHMSDTPLEIVPDNGSASDPVRSMWQTAALGIRLIIDMDWTLRDPGAVAYRDDVIW